jgi:hypothetical protein
MGYGAIAQWPCRSLCYPAFIRKKQPEKFIKPGSIIVHPGNYFFTVGFGMFF